MAHQFSGFVEMNSDNVRLNAQGVQGTAAALSSTNIDLKLVNPSVLISATVISKGIKFGDKVTLQVVDLDNVTGTSPIILNTYGTNLFLRDDSEMQIEVKNIVPINIPAGCYLRAIYTTTSILAVTVAVDYMVLDVLVP